MSETLASLAGVLVGALLGYWFARLAKTQDDKQSAQGLLTVLQQDVIRCAALFEEYERLHDGAPAWRLPTTTWSAALPFLAGLKAFTGEELATLARFFAIATELNYCLDRVADPDLASFTHVEVQRALLKVKHALNREADEPRLIDSARAAIDAAVGRQ